MRWSEADYLNYLAGKAGAKPTPTPAALPEARFMADVLALAKMYGWMAYHTYDSRKSAKGFPDLVLVRDEVLWIELKSKDGKVTMEQQQWLKALEHAGQRCYVWRPSERDQVEDILAHNGHKEATP